MNEVLSIREVVNDYFLHGETPLAIAYRKRMQTGMIPASNKLLKSCRYGYEKG